MAKSVEHYQNMLIPVNILIVLLCLVAAASLIFMPLLSIDLGALSGVVEEATGSATYPEEPSEPDEGGTAAVFPLADEEENPDASEEEVLDEVMNVVLAEAFRYLDGVEISLSTFDICRFSFAEDPSEVLAEGAIDIVGQAAGRLTVGMLLTSIVQEEHNVDLGETEIDTKVLFDTLSELEDVSTTAERDLVIATFTASLQEQLGTSLISDGMRDSIGQSIAELYDSTVQETKGDFSIEALVCISITKDSEGGTVTSYEELFGDLFGEGLKGEEAAPLREAVQMVANIVKYVAYVLIAYAAVWFILAVFAFVHIFTYNKKCTMWYVKSFGLTPCLVFGVVPLILRLFLQEMFGAIGTALGAIHSWTWISGGCYVLLWLISVFWAHPIKRKIKHADDDFFLSDEPY